MTSYENLISVKIKDCDNYLLYENGDIINTKNNKKIDMKIYNSTYFVNLNKFGKYPLFSLLKLIYENFNDVVMARNDIVKFKNKDSDDKFHYTNLYLVKKKYIQQNENHEELDKTKEWKIIKNYPDYKISNCGDIFSVKSSQILKPTLNEGGYYKIALTNDTNKRKSMSVHRLLYNTFEGIIDEDKVIDHIDRNKINNKLSNLREASLSENAINCEKKKKVPRKIHQYSLDNEFIKEWNSLEEIKTELGYASKRILNCCLGKLESVHKFIWKNPNIITDLNEFVVVNTRNNNKFSNYKINKKGIVINKHNMILTQSIHNGYYNAGLQNDEGKLITLLTHRLVGQTFLKNPNNFEIINHIDENKLNNNIKNLEWTTHRKNIIHSQGKKINKIDFKSGEILKTYSSISNAAVEINKNNYKSICKNISATLNKRTKSSHGFKWEYVE